MSRNDDLATRSAGFVQDDCLSGAKLDRRSVVAAAESTPLAWRARLLARVLAWACLATIAVLSLVPGELRPHSFLPGEAEHFIAYAVAGLLLALAYPSTRERLLGWLCLSLASGGFEILQNFAPGRSPSVWDAVASTAGLTFGMLLGAASPRKYRRDHGAKID